MRFINPKTDYAFKKIFGSTQSKEILISFLNAILYQEQEIIKDLEIIDPYLPGATFGLKDTYLDVRARLNDDSLVIIEMQILNPLAFDKRILYNAAKAYSNQLEIGENYHLLNPVIAVTIIDFILFKSSEKIITKFVFKEEEENLKIQDETIRLVFVELPKFKKKLEELETICDKWIYFIKNAPQFKEKPGIMTEIPVLDKALEIANRVNSTPEELEAIEKRAFWLADQKAREINAREMGRVEGLAEGEQIAIQRQKKSIIKIITRKFGEVSADILPKIEELSLEKLEELGEELPFFSSLDDLINWLERSLL